jgi:Tol biopolymer transport system component
MNTRGCALVLVLLLIIVLAYGLLSTNSIFDIALPTFLVPTFGSIGTLQPIVTGPVLPTIGVPPIPPTSAPYKTLTPAPTGIPALTNGRLVFLGFDQAIWSVNPDGTDAVRLGYFSDFHVYSPGGWHSADGRFALVIQNEEQVKVAYLAAVDGSQAVKLAPVSQEFHLGAPRDVFSFTTSGSRFYFLDTTANPANLLVYDLKNGTNLTWPVQASAEELTYAAFAGNDRLLIKAYDPAINGHYLELFDITSVLANPRRIAELRDHKIIQFAASPGGLWAAVVFRAQAEGDNPDLLYVVNLETLEMRPIIDQPGAKVLLINPAWSPNGHYLLANVWTPGQPFLYNLFSYDVQANKAAKIISDIASSAVGQPLSRVTSFSPDGDVAGIYLYDEKPDTVAFLRAVLDGTQTLRITEASMVNRLPQGEFVSAVARDWTHMLVISPQSGMPSGDLYATWMDGNGRQLLDGPVPFRFFELGPVISPDGKNTAYLRIDLAGQQAELVTIGLDGKERKVLFAGVAPQGDEPPVGLPLAWLPRP